MNSHARVLSQRPSGKGSDSMAERRSFRTRGERRKYFGQPPSLQLIIIIIMTFPPKFSSENYDVMPIQTISRTLGKSDQQKPYSW